MEAQMVDFNIKVLNENMYGPNPFSHSITLLATESIIIPPKTDALIPLGITFCIPDGYTLDIKLKEDLIDKSLLLIGSTFSPQAKGQEFGIMVFNCNKQSVRIEQEDEILVLNLIKTENLKITIID